MRILHVTNTYLPVRNGVTVSVSGWVKALADEGHDVHVWTVSNERALPAHTFASAGFAEIAHGFPLPLRTAAPREVAEIHWDVVHAHHPVLLGRGALRLAKRQGALFAATVHSDYVAYVDSYVAAIGAVARPVVRSRVRRFFQACDAVFVPSPGIGEAVRSWGVERDLLPLTYPIVRDAFGGISREEARLRLGLHASVPLAVYAGRLAADKRVERLLNEFKVARSRVPDAVLVMIGDGPRAAGVSSRRTSFGDALLLPGELQPAEIGLWYAAADIFVSASPNEVGPLALLEAGLSRTAAVAQDVPGFRDRIVNRHNGLLAGTSPGELGARMADALSDRKAAHRMGMRAAEAFSDHRPDRSAKLLLDAYRAVRSRAEAEAREAVGSRYSAEAERS